MLMLCSTAAQKIATVVPVMAKRYCQIIYAFTNDHRFQLPLELTLNKLAR